MHVDTYISPSAEAPLAGVQPHPHADVRIVGPGMPLERALRFDSGAHSGDGGREGGEERVALRPDHCAVVRLHRGTHETVMLLQQRRIGVTEALDEACASLDVGEQERHRARRQIGTTTHVHIMAQQAA